MAGIRERLTEILRPTVLQDMRFPDELWADRRAQKMADDIIRELGLCEHTVGEPASMRWWATDFQHLNDHGEWEFPAAETKVTWPSPAFAPECTCLTDPTISHYCGIHGDPTNPGGDCK